MMEVYIPRGFLNTVWIDVDFVRITRERYLIFGDLSSPPLIIFPILTTGSVIPKKKKSQ